ncbi:MAG: carbohydrate ABC transporter permease [Chloroflexota bacterium]
MAATETPSAHGIGKEPLFRRKSPLDVFLGRDWRVSSVFVLPVLVVLVGFIAYPFLSAIWLSLNAKMVGGEARFIGLANYQKLLGDDAFRRVATTSAIYTLFGVGLKFVVGLAAALVLHEALRPKNLWRMLLFLPWSIPVVIGAYTWRWIYDDLSGVLSQTLIQLGLTQDYILWLANKDLTLRSILAVVVWQGTPFYTMNFLAGLAAIPSELYEAAEVDGASVLRKFWHITVPGMVPVIIIVLMLSTIWTANDMQYVYILTRGGPQGVSEVFPYFAYKTAIEVRNLGLGATVPLMFFPFLAVIMYFLTARMLKED